MHQQNRPRDAIIIGNVVPAINKPAPTDAAVLTTSIATAVLCSSAVYFGLFTSSYTSNAPLTTEAPAPPHVPRAFAFSAKPLNLSASSLHRGDGSTESHSYNHALCYARQPRNLPR
jgi:hypothetical protein